MERHDYLAAIEADAAALVDAARAGPDRPAPSCPGWTTGHLLVHVGRAYRWIAEIAATRAATPVPLRPDDHAFDRADPGVFAWFDASLAAFRAAFADLDPATPLWTWSHDRRAGFWLQVAAAETALHRWDAQLAHGRPAPIAAGLARASIDHTLDHWLQQCRPASLLPARGESYHFHRTDGEGEWTVRFVRGEIVVTREHARGDVALRGAASDLLLYLWHRAPEERLEILGERATLARWFELVPPR